MKFSTYLNPLIHPEKYAIKTDPGTILPAAINTWSRVVALN